MEAREAAAPGPGDSSVRRNTLFAIPAIAFLLLLAVAGAMLDNNVTARNPPAAAPETRTAAVAQPAMAVVEPKQPLMIRLDQPLVIRAGRR